jgi:hypothetical protein
LVTILLAHLRLPKLITTLIIDLDRLLGLPL